MHKFQELQKTKLFTNKLKNEFKMKNQEFMELNAQELKEINGGILPLAVIGGVWAFQVACCVVALGMKAALDDNTK